MSPEVSELLKKALALLAELNSAVSWYLERNEMAATRFVAEIDRAVKLVTDAPARWPLGEHGTRKFALRRFPFAIVYRVTSDKIQILAFAHGHRHPNYWKERL